MRTSLIGGALVALAVSLVACGGSSSNSASEDTIRRDADLHAIEEIAKKWHMSTSRHDIDLLMSLWAARGTWTVEPGRTLVGKTQIRRFLRSESPAFKPENRWVSLATMYKTRITADGDRGTLYFECHYVDPGTKRLVRTVAADQDVARIEGSWLITNMVGASPTLSP